MSTHINKQPHKKLRGHIISFPLAEALKNTRQVNPQSVSPRLVASRGLCPTDVHHQLVMWFLHHPSPDVLSCPHVPLFVDLDVSDVSLSAYTPTNTEHTQRTNPIKA